MARLIVTAGSRITNHKPRFDVLGLGCTAVDEILYVTRYPAADAKIEVRRRERHCGGLCATALVAAARLGARCAYAGILGDDEDSRFVLGALQREGINTGKVVRRVGAGPVCSVIVVDGTHGTRNVFYDCSRARGAAARLPAGHVILSTRVLLVDRFGIPGMIRAARLARHAGIPVVGDFESSQAPRFRELFALTDHVILSEEFACELAGAASPAGAAVGLWTSDRRAVVVTCGHRKGWFYEGPADKPKPFPAFRVPVADTTGCGDVFHGAYAVALAEGKRLEDRVRFASAASALKATKSGGQMGIPSRAALARFLGGRGYP